MRRFNCSLAWCLACTLVLFAACGGSDDNTGDADSGEPDAALADAGTFDAGSLDAGVVDAGVIDAGTIDAGTLDAGVIDAGLPDAGHGDAGSPDAGAHDGGAVAGCTACHQTTSLTQGAHPAHLQTGTVSIAMRCSECHVVPTDLAHATQPLSVAFATEAGDIAKNDGLAPTWSAPSLTCASAYCHGASLSGGAATSPVWTRLDGTYAACTSCHGNPPTANGHVQCSKNFCNVCHLGSLPGGRLDLTANTHLNGLVDLLPKAQWGTVNHGTNSAPTGHPDGVELAACAVCHSTPMTCFSCHL